MVARLVEWVRTSLGKTHHLRGGVRAPQPGVHAMYKVLEDITKASNAGLMEEVARQLQSLVASLDERRLYDEARSSYDLAISILRDFDQESPGKHRSSLAQSLHGRGHDLHKLGCHEEGRPMLGEALRLRRSLARADLNTHRTDLANSLHTLGDNFYYLQRYEEALPLLEEAIQIRRDLSEENPSMDRRSWLADSLHVLGRSLYKHGRCEEALVVLEEELAIRRSLSMYRRSCLAHSVHSLGQTLYALSRYEEALDMLEEAIRIRRGLVRKDPNGSGITGGTYRGDLADSLHWFGESLFELERYKKGLMMFDEAVQIFCELKAENPARYRAYFMKSIKGLAKCLAKLSAPEPDDSEEGYATVIS